ncbi:hypothetical protein ACTFIW_004678 [Dictyostelium discoideum]
MTSSSLSKSSSTSSTSSTSSKNEEKGEKKVYDLISLEVPRLQGLLLRSTLFLCENHYLKNSFLSSLYTKNKMPLISQFNLNLSPTFYPIVDISNHQQQQQQNKSEFTFKKYLATDMLHDKDLIKYLQSKNSEINNQPSSSSSSNNQSLINNIPENSIINYYNLYMTGKITPNEIAKFFIECKNHSDEQSPPLKAFIKILEDDIKSQAMASAERWKSGSPLSLIDGVPISLKDELDQIGYYTTCGTTFLEKVFPNVKTEDSSVAKMLRQQGAILVGKNNMHEIGISTLGYNTHFGFTRNPYNLNHYPGGSSSGSASSVSAGLNPLSIGCDGGGSIRVPASLCGVVGLKPTFARVSHGGIFDLCWSVGHVGPIGSSVIDTAIGYACIAGSDPADHQSVLAEQYGGKPTVPMFTEIPLIQPLKGLKIGVFYDWINDCNIEFKDSTYKCIEILKEQGAEIIEIEISNLLVTRLSQGAIILSEMNSSMKRFKNYSNELQYDSRISLSIGNILPTSDYLQANKIRTYCIEQFTEIFKGVDLIVTPTNAIAAPEIEKSVLSMGESNFGSVGELMKYVFVGNITGIPGITVPVGLTKDKNLPIGFQIMAKWWQEDLLLYTSYVLEKNIDFKGKPQYYNCPLTNCTNPNN